MPPKRPTRADRMIVAKSLRREAAEKRETAQRHRTTAQTDTTPGIPEFFNRFAAKEETAAARWDRVAAWMVGDV